MENKISPAKSGLQLGMLFGVIMVLEFVISYIIGIEKLIGSSFGIVINLLNYLIFLLLRLSIFVILNPIFKFLTSFVS